MFDQIFTKCTNKILFKPIFKLRDRSEFISGGGAGKYENETINLIILFSE